MYRAYISVVMILFRTYGCTSFLSTMCLSCLLTGRRKAIVLFGNRISCIIIYVMNNLVNPRAWWLRSIKITVLFVGRCFFGKIPPSWLRIRSGFSKTGTVTFLSCAQNVKIICFSLRTYFRSFNAETCLLEIALNRILGLYRWDWSNQFYFDGASGSVIDWELVLELKLFENLN